MNIEVRSVYICTGSSEVYRITCM